MGEGPTKWGLVGKMFWAFQAGCIRQGGGECLEHCKPSVVGKLRPGGQGEEDSLCSPPPPAGKDSISLGCRARAAGFSGLPCGFWL